jgi:murein DD-endopeptidase MepM/ murein hydrolase activator NlpD
MSPPRFDALAFVALFLIFFMGFKVFTQRTLAQPLASVNVTVNLENTGGHAELILPSDEQAAQETPILEEIEVTDEEEQPDIIAPYEEYALTQGLHGTSYGHLAIDIAAGQGATILAPITGKISEYYIDEYGNPTLVIENKKYRITLLHGKYSVSVGQKVKQGEPIGEESNLGYTLDMQGNSCAGRNCGYHTHLNIFDKRLEQNVNPLEVMAP